jgi:hypothetical protein
MSEMVTHPLIANASLMNPLSAVGEQNLLEIVHELSIHSRCAGSLRRHR